MCTQAELPDTARVINCMNQAQLNLDSFHPGTCGLAMCDGSAHMVSENISLIVLCRLIRLKGHIRRCRRVSDSIGSVLRALK